MSAGYRINRWADLRLWLLILGLVLLGSTALRPAIPFESSTYRHLLVFDITQSMNVRDMSLRGQSSTRLEFAKAAVVAALGRLPCGSNVGLGIFTGHRTFVLSTPVDVCKNFGELVRMIGAIDWRMAWTAKSEIAKGVHSALLASEALGNETTLVFLTDGHEAPPINPDYRPRFDGRPGKVNGALGGIGATSPVPIPKLDADGKQTGFWKPEDVLQVDAFTLGRSGSVAQESLVGVEPGIVAQRIAVGTEHLSSLRERYLEQLARELRLAYRRIHSTAEMSELLLSRGLAMTRIVSTDLRWLAALLAMLALLAIHVLPAGLQAAADPGE